MNLSPLPIQKFFDNAGRPLNGGLLFTYVPATTTKLATYQDQAGTPNTNPIVLNFRGEANVWLDQTLVYKFVLAPANDTDPPTNPIWSVDNISASVTYASLTQQIIGQILYPRTQAEINAAAVPINYWYQPMYVDRYATNTTPGTTSMAAAFQAAINVAKRVGGTVRWGATTHYLLDTALDATTGPGQVPTAFGLSFEQDANPLAVTTNAPYNGGIIAKHTGHVFDCTGTYGITFRYVTITTDTVIYPKTAFFLARSTDLESMTVQLWNCRFYGFASKAVFYGYGSENDLLSACIMFNAATDAGAKTVAWTGNNALGLTSTFQTIAGTPQSTTGHTIRDGEYHQFGGSATSDIFYLEAASKITIDSPFLASHSVATSIRSYVYIDTTTSPTSQITFTGIYSEPSTHAPTYGVYFGNAASTPAYVNINNCSFNCITSKLFTAALVIADNFYIDGMATESGTPNINFAGTLQNSRIAELGTNVLIGTSTNNVLSVGINNLTVATRTGDFWACPGTQSWTPGTAGLPHGGVLTASNTTLAYEGRELVATLTLSDTVSITCAAGQLITGLPRSIVIGSGQVTVNNDTDSVSIGTGKVTGTSIALPAFAVGVKNVSIVARYFVA